MIKVRLSSRSLSDGSKVFAIDIEGRGAVIVDAASRWDAERLQDTLWRAFNAHTVEGAERV